MSNNIPAELRERPQWVVWRFEERDGKQTKVPYRADGAGRASTTDPATWASYDAALSAADDADGIGFVFSPDDPYVGIDLDSLDSDAGAIILALDSYTEHSVSGRGAHVIVRASLNGHPRRRRGPLEVYGEARFFVVTGQHMDGTPATIEERQERLESVLARFLPAAEVATSAGPAASPVGLDDQELLERMFAASNGDEIRRLWNGDTSAHDGDRSRADLALLAHLAFWTGRDSARMERLFSSSALGQRDKWRTREDYRARTIQTALGGCSQSYKSYSEPLSKLSKTRVSGLGDSGLDSDSDLRESETYESPDLRDQVLPDSAEQPESDRDPTVTLDAFVADRDESAADPLIEHDKGAILVAAGLMLLVAKTGAGKTTELVDLFLHAASGIDYPPLKFPRPLRLLIVQNEGPREAFRQKLEARLATWPHTTEFIRVWDNKEAWGGVQVSEAEARTRLASVCAKHEIDVVGADSLTRFGMRGNGTPEETREFIERLNEVGLHRDRAFLLLHHPITRPDPSLDELEQITGAWGPHADAILFLRKLTDNRSRLSFPKTRWPRGEVPAVLLGFDPETEAFSYIGEEAEEERDYLAELQALFTDRVWRTPSEISAPKPAGMGANVDVVKKMLAEHPDLFEPRTGDAAKALGRSKNAVVWQLRDEIRTDLADEDGFVPPDADADFYFDLEERDA